MEKEDARYQTLAQLHERRKQVVRLHKQGIKVMRIVEMVGLSYPSVRNVIDLFVKGGWPAIRPAGRGRESGQGRLLSDGQERLNADLKQTIGKKVPVRTKAKLRDATYQLMGMLETNPERIRSFFQDQYVKYAD